ncbi:MAG: hypothetical protein ACI9SC_002457, partial [Gammaproteobacteria bacterium]
GSSPGEQTEYMDAAINLGNELVRRDLELVYGGGDVGLMGIIANTVMSSGGKVIGVIPEFMTKKEVAHNHLTELHIVQSMHERKAMMSELSDGIIALPGGIGTFEELFEVLTWQQLGIQSKPCALLNTRNYFEHLLKLMAHAVTEGFLKPVHQEMLMVGESAEQVVECLMKYEHSHTDKWADDISIADQEKLI